MGFRYPFVISAQQGNATSSRLGCGAAKINDLYRDPPDCRTLSVLGELLFELMSASEERLVKYDEIGKGGNRNRTDDRSIVISG